MASMERLILEKICDEMRSVRELTLTQWRRLHSSFGDRFNKAWNLLEQRRIKKYIFYPSGRKSWIVVGQEAEYQILPASGYCSCNDFYYRVINGGAGVCYHLIGQRLAEALGAYDEVHEGDEFFNTLRTEWRRQPIIEADCMSRDDLER